MNQLPVHVINLAHRDDRRARATEQLQGAGVAFSFFTAIDRAAGYKHFAGINRLMCFMSLGRQPSDAEVGCFASHMSLWKLCCETGAPLIIMEDDFRLSDDFAAAMETLPAHIDRCGIIRLDSLHRGRFRERDARTIARAGRFTLDYLARVPLNATAYALTPAAASGLLAHCNTLPTALDNYLQLGPLHQQAIVALRPEPVELSELAAASSIVEGDRDRKSFGHRAARILRIPFKIWTTWRRKTLTRKHLAALARSYGATAAPAQPIT